MADFENILKAWNVIPANIEPFGIKDQRVYRITTVEGVVLTLKPFPIQHDAEREGALLHDLARAGAPVPAVMRTQTSTYAAHDDAYQYMLYPFMEGETITEFFGADRLENARMFGRGLARLHIAMTSIPQPGDFSLMDLRDLSLDHTRRTLISKYEELSSVYAILDDELASVYDELPIHIIHRDPHPGNMLVQQGQVTGYLDFEISVQGPRIFDVAYATTAILSEVQDEDETRRRQWLDIMASLIAGYHGLNPLLPVELYCFWHIQLCIQLLFIAYFQQPEHQHLAQINLDKLWWIYHHREDITRRIAR